MLEIFCFVGLLAPSFAQIVTVQGSCPLLTHIPNFDENQLIGEWFEWARIENYYQPDRACAVVTYFRNDDGYIAERFISLIRGSGAWTIWVGRLIPILEQPAAQYHIAFSKYSRDTGYNQTFVAANWNHWVIFHGCKQEENRVSQFLWVLTKDYRLEQQYQDQITGVIKNMNLPLGNFTMVDHNHCPNHD